MVLCSKKLLPRQGLPAIVVCMPPNVIVHYKPQHKVHQTVLLPDGACLFEEIPVGIYVSVKTQRVLIVCKIGVIVQEIPQHLVFIDPLDQVVVVV